MHADEKRVIPEAVYKFLTEEVQHETLVQDAQLCATQQPECQPTQTEQSRIYRIFVTAVCAKQKCCQKANSSKQCNKFVSQMLHVVLGQERHLGGAVQEQERHSVSGNIAY